MEHLGGSYSARMNDGAVKSYKTQKCVWRRTDMIHLNDWEVKWKSQVLTGLPSGKKEHMHLLRWILTLLPWHHFLL